MRYLLELALLPLALAAPAVVQRRSKLLPVAPGVDVIPGKYIVVLKTGMANTQVMSGMGNSFRPSHSYDWGAFKGFASPLNNDQILALEQDESVDYIENDIRLKINTLVTQQGATWGISRISHKANGSSTYVYDDSAGEGTCAYIVDTGTTPSHPEFEGRAVLGKVFDTTDNNDADMNGHGTHVSGTIASKTYGVAKKAKIIGVKVCNSGGFCDLSNVIAGVNFGVSDKATRGCPKGAVMNLSLGAPNSEWQSLKATIASATNNGVFVAVAAGNSAADASGYSPASEPSACTVGASDQTDAMAYFSNFGSIVDIFAPGDNILSTWNDGKTQLLSGTSMASPHIAGLGAYLLALEGTRTPTALCTRMRTLATKNVLASIPSGTGNYLAFNGATSTTNDDSGEGEDENEDE